MGRITPGDILGTTRLRQNPLIIVSKADDPGTILIILQPNLGENAV